jgi:phosphoglycerate dehydrogenase-like enzyme
VSEPRVLSLTPDEVLGPVHRRLAPELADHRLIELESTTPGLAEELGQADYVIGDWTHQHRLGAELLARAERCLAIFQPTAGVQAIDVDRAAELGIPVANAPGTNDRAVAEWTVMAILALLKDVWRHHAGVLSGQWNMVAAARTGVYELGGRTVGIVGFGTIGQAVASRLAGFELGRLVYADEVAAAPEVERSLGAERVELDELCRVSDAVTLHVPLLESTRGLFGARRLALLPRGAVLVNAARGAVVDEPALCAALQSGQLKGAALDVFEREPLPREDPLRRLDNVLFSPHLAGSTNEARERMITGAVRNLDRTLRGGDPEHVVNGVRGVPRRGR